MVGIDENSYSDIALQWMLEELVDDGDQIICLRVVDKDSKLITDRALEIKQYQQDARELLDAIQKKNDDNKAVSIVLEYAIGKVHTTFQKMVCLDRLMFAENYRHLLTIRVSRSKFTNLRCSSLELGGEVLGGSKV